MGTSDFPWTLTIGLRGAPFPVAIFTFDGIQAKRMDATRLVSAAAQLLAICGQTFLQVT
jgi:hypothetical protein